MALAAGLVSCQQISKRPAFLISLLLSRLISTVYTSSMLISYTAESRAIGCRWSWIAGASGRRSPSSWSRSCRCLTLRKAADDSHFQEGVHTSKDIKATISSAGRRPRRQLPESIHVCCCFPSLISHQAPDRQHYHPALYHFLIDRTVDGRRSSIDMARLLIIRALARVWIFAALQLSDKETK